MRLALLTAVSTGAVGLTTGCADGTTRDTTTDEPTPIDETEDGGPAGGADAGVDAGLACSALDCDVHAHCVDDASGPSCECDTGFEGDGRTCEDIDECADGTAGCDPNATCTNTDGSFTCTCAAGYTGDGTTCTSGDPCGDGTAVCDVNATCEAVGGSFVCTCLDGYTGDGATCTDVDECADGTATCDATAECQNVEGSYACVCDPGYQLQDGTCVDIDECLTGADDCASDAICTNTAGAFTCACNAGFSGDGVTCADIDECAAEPTQCGTNATCRNTPGSSLCVCNTGFSGDGVTCTPRWLTVPGEVSIDAAAAAAASTSVTLYLQEPGNALTNPGGETGDLTGWSVSSGTGSTWEAASGDPGIYLFGSKHFIGSYSWSTRTQIVDLLAMGYTQAELDAQPPITVRDWFRGAGYNRSDKFGMTVVLQNAAGTTLASYTNGTQNAPLTTNDTWQLSTKTISAYGTGLRYVSFEDGGDDAENWAGQYGIAIDQSSVVLGTYQVRFSNDNVTWSAYQEFTPTAAWTLESGAGPKTVYVQFMDSTGFEWPAISDTITLQ